MSTRTILDSDTVGDYLRSQNHIDADSHLHVESLGGGVSNTVLRITHQNGCLVVKQPLPDLAVDEEWLADLDRVHNEATAARAYQTILSENNIARIRIPTILFEDYTNHVLGIECAPHDTISWKSSLLDGDVDTAIAQRLGTFLGTSHSATAGDETLASRFSNDAPFTQLRLNPYHRTVARRHDDLSPIIHDEITRIKNVHRTLVHGDFSPKNVLVESHGSAPALWLLDFEVANWGDPSFDVAFMLNHLLLKAVVRPTQRPTLATAARAFLAAYTQHVPWNIESRTIRELAILMLARVDGKSPVEYITNPHTKDTLRTVARTALHSEIETLDEYITLLHNTIDQ